MSRVTIMLGIPGSGKTTWLKTHRPKAEVCSADHFFTDEEGTYTRDAKQLRRAHRECLQDFMSALDCGEPEVAVDNTNTQHITIAPYVAIAQAYGYDVEFVAMTSRHIDLCKKEGLHDVPDKAVDNMVRKLSKALMHWPSFWPKVKYDDEV